MDFNTFYHLVKAWNYSGSIVHTEKENLSIALKSLSEENMFFEGIHVSLFNEDSESFYDKVWEAFSKRNKESFELYFTGLQPTGRLDKNESVEFRAERRKRLHGHENGLRELLFNGTLYIKFCKKCTNIQIFNRIERVCSNKLNLCCHCKGNYNKGRDLQFFSNLSLLHGPSKKIVQGRRPSRVLKRVTDLKGNKLREYLQRLPKKDIIECLTYAIKNPIKEV
jgi:hypothetical protein